MALRSGAADAKYPKTGTKVSLEGLDFHAVAYSADGAVLAGALSATRELRMYETRGYKTIRKIVLPKPVEDPVPEDFISSLSFSPSGKILACGGFGTYATLVLWDPATGHEVGRLHGHQGPVYAVRFSPDGRLLASCSWDHTVRLWDVVAKHELRLLDGHSGPVYAVAFAPDGKTVASAGAGDGPVRQWDVTTGRQIAKFLGHKTWARTIAFAPDGRTIASGGHDGTIRLWEVGRPGDRPCEVAQLIGPGRSIGRLLRGWSPAIRDRRGRNPRVRYRATS